jgi:hypothetical protein
MSLEIDHLLPRVDRFTRPDWEGLEEHIELRFEEAEFEQAWSEVARAWVERLREELGPDFRAVEAGRFLILTDANAARAKEIADFLQVSRNAILQQLNGVAEAGGFGPHIAMLFSREADYYDYVAYHYEDDEESPPSGGVFLMDGYMHFALVTHDFSMFRHTIVHEMTHLCLAHLPMPLWLNEALSMRMEEIICRSAHYAFDYDTHERHMRHWNEDTIQEFWSGESWQSVGEANELSYNLARLLWRKIEIDLNASMEEMRRFLLQAQHEDAGAEAFSRVFDMALGDLAGDYLGDGDWHPDPARWVDWEAG